jgi:hypothetical protein
LEIALDTLTLKNHFAGSHHVAVTQVIPEGNSYFVLVNIWETESYNSQKQLILVFKKLNIVKEYKLPGHVLWNCMQIAEDGSFLLGSKYSDNYSGAVLAFFKNDKVTVSQTIDKGYATEITRIEKENNDDCYAIQGLWYQRYAAGSHDDFYPERWSEKVVLTHSDFVLQGALSVDFRKGNSKILEPGSGPQPYYVIEDYGVSKYSADNVLMWNQAPGNLNLEHLKPVDLIAPYYRVQGGDSIFDGVWFSGSDTTLGVSFPPPFLGFVSKSGTIILLHDALENYPEIRKIHAIVSGKKSNCLVVAETLRIGEGSGLCLIYFQLTQGFIRKTIKYINSCEKGVNLVIEDDPKFFDQYLYALSVYPQTDILEDLDEIIIFGEMNHFHNRNNGHVWSVKINKEFFNT